MTQGMLNSSATWIADMVAKSASTMSKGPSSRSKSSSSWRVTPLQHTLLRPKIHPKSNGCWNKLDIQKPLRQQAQVCHACRTQGRWLHTFSTGLHLTSCDLSSRESCKIVCIRFIADVVHRAPSVFLQNWDPQGFNTKIVYLLLAMQALQEAVCNFKHLCGRETDLIESLQENWHAMCILEQIFRHPK